jgi:hypothetical protein
MQFWNNSALYLIAVLVQAKASKLLELTTDTAVANRATWEVFVDGRRLA